MPICTRELEVEPLLMEDFTRALGERGCDGDSCIREATLEPIPVEILLGNRRTADAVKMAASVN